MSRLALVLRLARHLTTAWALIVLAWVGVAKADPPQPPEGSSPEELEATVKPRKEIGPTRRVGGAALKRSSTSRAGSPTVVLTLEQMKEAREIAAMILSEAPEQAIRNRVARTIGVYTKMASRTEGAEAKADMAAVEAMRQQVLKEVWESEREKAEELTQAQREHIRKMLEMIEEMMKQQAVQFDTTLSR